MVLFIFQIALMDNEEIPSCQQMAANKKSRHLLAKSGVPYLRAKRIGDGVLELNLEMQNQNEFLYNAAAKPLYNLALYTIGDPPCIGSTSHNRRLC